MAGTNVYEERREESMRIMQDTNSKRDKIQEVVEYIQQRLAELEGEKEELRAYQGLDKRRRALEYNVYDKELQEANATVSKAAHRMLSAVRLTLPSCSWRRWRRSSPSSRGPPRSCTTRRWPPQIAFERLRSSCSTGGSWCVLL